MTEHELGEKIQDGMAPKAEGYDTLMSDLAELWMATENGETVDEAYAKSCLDQALDGLTDGSLCVVQSPTPCGHSDDAPWSVNIPLKQAILMVFRFFNTAEQGFSSLWWDKIPLLLGQEKWKKDGTRVVPGAFIRHGAYLGKSCIIMPSFINMGAHVGHKTMIDGGAHIGSCAFIGERCHISANATIGGVLEPLQALPVIIEDEVFVGAGCQVVEGVHVGKGSILASGVVLTSSTKVIDRATGKQITGRIPAYSVIIPGTYASGHYGLSIACAIIAKTRQPEESPKTALTDALRI
jgi:2,3,4,5-tetrahydropyridine-2-carboxylate N-succinyltransferase